MALETIDGALLARILFQIIQGFATALAGKKKADVQDTAGALAAGAE